MADSDPDRDPNDAPNGDEAGVSGRMRFQDEHTTPREATLAERKARERAARRQQEEDDRRYAEGQRSRTKRKRIMIGAGVTVGVVALIAVGYTLAQPEEQVQAQCVDEDDIIVDEVNCVTPATGSSSTYYGGGPGFFPIFIGAGGRQYHYNYGGSGSFGDRVSGGTTTVPREGTTVRTTSGRTATVSTSSGTSVSKSGSSSVSRGGLGSSSSSGSSSKSGSSRSSSGGG
jgi:hypothetical protein